MDLLLLLLFIAATIEIIKYGVVFGIKLMNNPPSPLTITIQDEIILVISTSYFLSYIII
jgi:hypothetical protein